MVEKREWHYPPLLVIVAALNEEEGIGPTIAELRQYLGNPRVLVVDGKSCDRTAEIARAMGAEVICQEGKGKGDAIATAVKHINVGPDYVIFTDADYTFRIDVGLMDRLSVCRSHISCRLFKFLFAHSRKTISNTNRSETNTRYPFLGINE